MNMLPYAVAAWLFVIGLYGVVSSRNLIHLCVCLSVLQSSTYVLLISIGYRAGARAPILTGIPKNSPIVDPVVQALVLTDVVVEVTVLALLLALSVRAGILFGTMDPDELTSQRG
jgi:multicomponent Na+:H+ antiporter subunit C